MRAAHPRVESGNRTSLVDVLGAQQAAPPENRVKRHAEPCACPCAPSSELCV